MPNATITSTASTFGTISGTFAADQSTVTGTIAGIITGTLDGSVGVPGPAGPTGAQGPQGDPGEGVPVGGSAGQVLAKIDGTNYNTEWVNVEGDYLPLAGGAMDANASITASDTGTATDSELAGWGLGVQLSADHTQGTIVGYNGLDTYDGSGHMIVGATGLTFPDATIQTTAAVTPDLSGYAPLASPALTGNPTAPTPSIGDNDTSIATTAFVKAQGYLYAPTISWSYGSPAIDDTVTGLSVLTTASNFLFSASTTSYVDDGLGAAIVSESGSLNLTKSGFSLYRYPVYNGQNPSGPTVGGELNYDSETAVLTLRAFTAAPTDNTITIAPTGVTLPNAGSITFGDATIQTTAAVTPDLSGYAPLASPALTGNPTAPTPSTNDNDTSIATTAYVKAQAFGDRYLSSSTTSNTLSNTTKTFTIGTDLSYTPTQNITISFDASNHMHGEVLTYSTSTGVLTVDINHHTGSGTYAAWVVNVGGVTPATTIAWGDITGTLSTQTDLQNALDLKANLASPTFTGTPSLPTGTTGITQTAGNNTTALATTAFVTAAVPAFATNAQLIASSSTTTVLTPKDYRLAGLTTNVWAPGYVNLAAGTSGTGSATGSSSFTLSGTLTAPNASTAGYATRGFLLHYPSNGGSTSYNFSTASGHAMRLYSASLGSTIAGVKARAVFGRTNVLISAASTLAVRGYGWEWDFSTRTMNIIAHNGTTLTTTAVTWNPSTSRTYEVVATSDGAGTISLYVDGTLLGTSSGGPTGLINTASNFVWWQAEVQNESTAGSQVSVQLTNPKVYTTNG